jgi:hypothetical protein
MVGIVAAEAFSSAMPDARLALASGDMVAPIIGQIRKASLAATTLSH